MSAQLKIPIGVIEGFFGRPWGWSARTSYADFLSELGFDFYIYAPKDDRRLRKQWREPWSTQTVQALTQLGNTYRSKGLRLGVGLSPFELHLNDPEKDAQALRQKTRELNQVNPDIVCILFDDMRGDMPELAERQARIIDMVCQESTATRFIVCPTYYSTDPLLEDIFGQMPANYLEDLGRLLDATIDVFWTGPQVCSRQYPQDHLRQVASRLGRKPFLWDNYPVNDSATMAPYLHLSPFQDRPAELQDFLAGHAVNPMNQPWLSRIAIRSLADSYRLGEQYDPDASFKAACHGLGNAELATGLIEDLDQFEQLGLANITEFQRAKMHQRYSVLDTPAAKEVCEWLAGDFAFDPDCLT